MSVERKDLLGGAGAELAKEDDMLVDPVGAVDDIEPLGAAVPDSVLEPEVVSGADDASATSESVLAASAAPCADLPSLEELEAELRRVKGKSRFRRALFGVLGVLVVVAAAAILVATRFLPVLQIYGDSMTPTLNEGEIVVAFDYGDLEQGDVVAFYYNNKVLVKRVIAGPGDWVDIKDDGTVYVNNRLLHEPYIDEAALGSCNITLPYQVPESHVFVMGDHRSDSIDSRNTAVGCVGEDQIIGELVVRIWPLEEIGLL